MARREPRWVKVFLKQLERCGNVRLAAEGAGVDFSTAYQRRKRHPDFAERWEGALRLHAERSAQDEREDEKTPSTGAVFAAPPSPSEGEGTVFRPDGKRIKSSESRWGKRAQEAFLLELTVSGNVSRAAAAAGFSTQAAYKRRMKDPHLAQAWDLAMETGKARVQAYLVEAATQTFDPDELPVADDRELPKVTIGQAISIARLKGAASAKQGAGGAAGPTYTRGGKGMEDRIYDETGFDCTPITREEWEQARENIVARLQRLREQTEEEERETGRCHSCGQRLPVPAS